VAATWVRISDRSFKSVQATTESAPSGAADGLNLTNVHAITFWLEADSGQTLSGAGDVDIYAYTSSTDWGLAPLLVFDVPATAASKRRVVLGTVAIDNPIGRLAMIANGVTVSSGGVTIYAMCSVDFQGDVRPA
jgi:hypothetical protein